MSFHVVWDSCSLALRASLFSDVDQAFLDKYGVTLNNAILCEEKHLPVFADLVANKSPQYIAGGATQNTARVCQWQTNAAGAVSYAGSIGKDEFGQKVSLKLKSSLPPFPIPPSPSTLLHLCSHASLL
jgi:hypothetical protein